MSIELDQADLVLASASPRRRELLQQLGVRFAVLAGDIDETPRADEAPSDYVTRLATGKARAIADRLAGQRATIAKPILGADTIVVLDEHLLGKPRDADDARQMLGHLSGREHQVVTAVCLWQGERHDTVAVTTQVRFRDLCSREIDAYVATGEPFGKAGAYAVQGLAAAFIANLAGSYTGVVGLPLFETAALLRAYSVPTELSRHLPPRPGPAK